MLHENTPRELNLTAHRAPANVWDRRGWNGTTEQLAMSRWLVGIGGSALAVQGLRHRSVSGSILAGVGTTLAWWALSGEGDLSDVSRRAARLLFLSCAFSSAAVWRRARQLHADRRPHGHNHGRPRPRCSAGSVGSGSGSVGTHCESEERRAADPRHHRHALEHIVRP